MARTIRHRVLAVRIDGQQYLAGPGEWTYRPDSVSREEQIGTDGHVSFVEEPQTAMLAGNIVDDGELDIKWLRNLSGVTVTAELANGKTIQIINAAQTNGEAVNLGNGQVPVEFKGRFSEELFA